MINKEKQQDSDSILIGSRLGQNKAVAVRSKQLKLSSLLEVFSQLAMCDDFKIVELIAMLADVADYENVFKWLQSRGQLTLGHWVVNYHDQERELLAKNRVIVALIREAIKSNDYEPIVDLVQKYDFTLKALLPHFIGNIIESIKVDPYYMELKLYLINIFFD